MTEVRRYSARKLESVLRDWNLLNRYSSEERREFYTKYDCEILNLASLLKISQEIVDASDRDWNGLMPSDRLDFIASLVASECVTSYIMF